MQERESGRWKYILERLIDTLACELGLDFNKIYSVVETGGMLSKIEMMRDWIFET